MGPEAALTNGDMELMDVGYRCVGVAQPALSHERERLEIVLALLPERTPFQAWSDFGCQDSQREWLDATVPARPRSHRRSVVLEGELVSCPRDSGP